MLVFILVFTASFSHAQFNPVQPKPKKLSLEPGPPLVFSKINVESFKNRSDEKRAAEYFKFLLSAKINKTQEVPIDSEVKSLDLVQFRKK